MHIFGRGTVEPNSTKRITYMKVSALIVKTTFVYIVGSFTPALKVIGHIIPYVKVHTIIHSLTR